MADADDIEVIVQDANGLLGNIYNANQPSLSISRVPVVLRKDNLEAYIPHEVFIGPFWSSSMHDNVEEFKNTYVSKLLLLSSNPKETFKACLKRVEELIHAIRACYAQMDNDYRFHNNMLRQEMVRDGCFILGFLNSERDDNNLVTVSIYKDLLLLENQIPFFVLKDIFELTILKSKPSASLTKHIKPLLEFGHRSLFKEDLKILSDLPDTTDHNHILDLLHKCYKPNKKFSKSFESKILNAMELKKAGVSFGPTRNASWPLAIEISFAREFPWFWAKPTLKIPILNIRADTEILFRNIIAYEQTSKVDRCFTSFMAAIDDLVDTREDIAMLVESKVIINNLESNEEAANMINKICKKALICNFYNEQWEKIDAYYNKKTTEIRRTYFSNPWSRINLSAGIILFFLTVTQTYFTINPRK